MSYYRTMCTQFVLIEKNNKMSTWTFKIVFPLHVNHDFKVLTAQFVVRFTTLHNNHSRSVIGTDLRTQINHLKALIACSNLCGSRIISQYVSFVNTAEYAQTRG